MKTKPNFLKELDLTDLQEDSNIIEKYSNLLKNNEIEIKKIVGNKLTNDFLKILSTIPLKELVIVNSHVKDKIAELVFENFEHHKHLEKLSLHFCSIIGGTMYLGHLMKKNESICYLSLINNHVKGNLLKYFLNCLSENETLETLILDYNSIGNEGGHYFGEFLKTNKSLTNLQLKCTKLRSEGISSIFKGLENNKTLKILSLSNNSVRIGGSMSIGEYLGNNKSLKSLDVSECLIDDQGMEYFMIGLLKNETLIDFYFANNEITLDGVEMLAGIIQWNQTIQKISFDSYLPIINDSAKILYKSLIFNNSMKELIIEERIDKDIDLKINQLLKLNIHVFELNSHFQCYHEIFHNFLDIKMNFKKN